MSTIRLDSETRVWSATELRRFPTEARDAILFAAAQLADSDYRDRNPSLVRRANGRTICMAAVPIPSRGEVWLGMKRLLFLVVALTGCQPSPNQNPVRVENPPDRETLDIDFANWASATKEPYFIAPLQFRFCAPPSTQEVQNLELEKKQRGPHSESAIVVRVNPIGFKPFQSGLSVPVGTIVVKEKYPHYSPDTPPVAVAAMIKREPGYDPKYGDWEYAYEQRWPEHERKVIRGKLDSCIDCHQNASGKDYMFRPYLAASR